MTTKKEGSVVSGFDFSQIDISDYADVGTWMDFVDPRTKEPSGVRVRVRSAYSDTVENVENKNTNRMLQNRNIKPTAELGKANAMAILVAAVADWEFSAVIDGEVVSVPFIREQGNDLECNPDNVRYMLKKYPDLKKQIEAYMEDTVNFLHT